MTGAAEAAELVLGRQGAMATILLNRPKVMNALTLEQIEVLGPTLTGWSADPDVAIVLIEGAGERAFCAGGDIRVLRGAAQAGDLPLIRNFFAKEYRLNRQIQFYGKPYVALLDGMVMGGGVGLSAHGRFRVATERTVFAMPETGIGHFPDVGGTYFLPRLPGELGLWLGLTGSRLGPADCLAAGLATHFVPSSRLSALKQALAAERADGPATMRVESILAGFKADPGEAPCLAKRPLIDQVFGADSLAELCRRAAELDPEGQVSAGLHNRCPTALAVTFRQIRLGRTLPFDEALRMEYRLSPRMAVRPDFIEGVRAVIIDKDNRPAWQPARLEDVTEEAVEAVFAPLPAVEELRF
jgi:enoyl-CoA hydratase